MHGPILYRGRGNVLQQEKKYRYRSIIIYFRPSE